MAVAPIKVAVADAQRLFAESLAAALDEEADLVVSPVCSTSGREIVREAARRPPDVALIDFWISDTAGPGAAQAVMQAAPCARVLFLTEYFIGPVQVEQARRSRALGFVGKGLGLHDIAAAIRSAAATPIPPQLDGHDVRATLVQGLSTREIEVLQLLRRGLAPKEVADELSISAGTVKNHIHRILAKTRVRSQVEAMMMAENEGLISGL